MQRFWGKYRATIADNQDPQYRGRIRVSSPLVYGRNSDSGELVVSPWALPCFAYGGSADMGSFAVPPIGSGVWIEFEQGDPDKPIWVGSWVQSPSGSGTEVPKEAVIKEGSGNRFAWNTEAGVGSEDNAPIPQSNPDRKDPQNCVFRTPAGHTIEIDDTENQLKIKVTDSSGQFLLFRPEDGNGGGPKILLKGAWGQYVFLNGKTGESKIEFKDKSGNIITMDAEDGSIHLENATGDYIDMLDGVMNIFARTDVNINTLDSKILLNCNSGSIELNSEGGEVVLNSLTGGHVDVNGTNVNVEALGTVQVHGNMVQIDAGAAIQIAGGGPAIARVGDSLSCGGIITTGSGKASCG
jgi:hypothetical protein